MDSRALLRRAFPYLVIGIGGFALAYVIIFLFVLPSKIVPPPKQPFTPTSPVLQPIDTSVVHLPEDTGFPQATVPMGMATEPPPDLGPTTVPDLVGMALADARAVLNSYRLRASVERDTSSFQPPNTVLRQSPAPDGRIASGGTVMLTVSYFPPETPAESVPQPFPGSLPPTQPSAHPTTAPPALPSTLPSTIPTTLPPARKSTTVPPSGVPHQAPAGSAGVDSVRPPRQLPRIIPMDTAPPPPPRLPPRHDTTTLPRATVPASTPFPG